MEEPKISLELAAQIYKEAYKKSEKARKAFEKKNERVVIRQSSLLQKEMRTLETSILKLQKDMSNRTRVYPKRGQWRKLKEMENKVQPLQERIEKALAKEAEEWIRHTKELSSVCLLGNETMKLAEQLLEKALE